MFNVVRQKTGVGLLTIVRSGVLCVAAEDFYTADYVRMIHGSILTVLCIRIEDPVAKLYYLSVSRDDCFY